MALRNLYLLVSSIVAIVHCTVNNDTEAGKDILDSTGVGIQVQNVFAAEDCENIKEDFKSIKTSLTAQNEQMHCAMSSIDEIYEIANETSESVKKQNTQFGNMVSSVASLESKLVSRNDQLKSIVTSLSNQDNLLQTLTAQVKTYISGLTDTNVVDNTTTTTTSTPTTNPTTTPTTTTTTTTSSPTTTTTTTDTVLTCPEYYDEFQGKCYRLFGTRTNWYKASEICKRFNGILAEPRSEAENNFIATRYRPSSFHAYNRVWLGGTAHISGGKEWNWASDGANILDGYHNWGYSGIPDTMSPSYQCLLMRLTGRRSNGEWSYKSCNSQEFGDKFRFVCQTTKVPAL